jgi:hypothetical protein
MSENTHPSGLTIRKPDLSLAKPTSWAWQHRIAVGYLNLLVGDEGIGKGVLAAWLIARWTKGDLPGNFRHKPVMVGIVADEDSFNDVWTPRLYAAGADFAFVRHVEHPEEGYLNLATDREALERAVDLDGFRVVYFDQLLDNLDALVDDYNQKSVRHALRPLRRIGRDFNIAVLAGLHPNKKRTGSFRELVAGTVAFNAVSRSSLLLAAHPDDADRRVLCRGKGNLSKTPSALDFEIESHRFEANSREFDVPRAGDFQESSLTVDDLINATAPKPAAGEARTSARELIANELADGDWHKAGVILKLCADAGIEKRAAQRAAHDDLGVEIEPRGFPSEAHWRLKPRVTPRTPRDLPVTDVTDVIRTGTTGAMDDTDDSENTGKGAVISAAVCGYPAHEDQWRAHPDSGRVVCWTCHPPGTSNGNGRHCHCERPILDGDSCAKCGRPILGALQEITA